jgi:hypothetical protein
MQDPRPSPRRFLFLPFLLPAANGPSAFGLTDMELGAKWGFLKQTTHRPQIGIFTMPASSAGRIPPGS